jgi:hypothetical protein
MCNGLTGCNPLKKQKRHIYEQKKLQDYPLDVNKIVKPCEVEIENRKEERGARINTNILKNKKVRSCKGKRIGNI